MVVQDCVQLAFDSLQEWRHHHLSGQPVPVLGHSHSEYLEGTSRVSVCPHCPWPWAALRRAWLHPLSYLLQLFTYTDKIPLGFSSKERCSTPLIVFVALCWILPSSSTSFFPQKHNSSEWDTVPSETTILRILYQEEIYLVIKPWNQLSNQESAATRLLLGTST